MIKRVLLAFALFVLVAAAASAQTGVTITGLTVTVQNSAGVAVGTPQTAVWPQPAGTCGLALTPDPTGTVINPQFARLLDPANQNLECRVNFGLYFATLPSASGYRFTLKFTYADGFISGASNVSGPFDEQAGFHAAPSGVGVR